MLNKLLKFIREQDMIHPGDRIVCAVSGGADIIIECHCQPERGIAGFAVGIVAAPDHIRYGAGFFKSGKLQQDVARFIQHPGGNQTAQGNERVAPPVQKPRITGDHSIEIIAFDHNSF